MKYALLAIVLFQYNQLAAQENIAKLLESQARIHLQSRLGGHNEIVKFETYSISLDTGTNGSYYRTKSALKYYEDNNNAFSVFDTAIVLFDEARRIIADSTIFKRKFDTVYTHDPRYSAGYKAANTHYWSGWAADSAEFADIYGTEDEFRMQRGLAYSSRRDGGGRLTLMGMKFYWLNELSIYLQHQGYGLGTTKTIPGGERWPFTEKVASGRNAYHINVDTKLNKQNRMTGITITGPLTEVIELFVGYWYEPGASKPYLAGSGIVKRQFYNDIITLRRSGTQGIISITKSGSK